MNAFSRLSEIIFSYEAGAKKYYVIILYTVIIVLKLFYLLKILDNYDVNKEDINVLCSLSI